MTMLTVLLWGCSAVKHVPAGNYLLDEVKVTLVDSAGNNTDAEGVSTMELVNFLRQTPNHEVLGFAKLSLATYSLSGADTTKWYNRWLRRVGQAPVIYDSTLTEASRRQLLQAMVNLGYMDARVSADTIHKGTKKMKVAYAIEPGEPHRVQSMGYNIADTAIRRLVLADVAAEGTLRPGMLLDRTALDNERSRIARMLRDRGYYRFTRENINYTADTLAGSTLTNLTMNIHAPAAAMAASPDSSLLTDRKHHRYMIRRVNFYIDCEPGAGIRDTVCHKGTYFYYGTDHYLRPQLLYDMCPISSGDTYSARSLERTYEALGRLAIVKFVNVRLEPVGSVAGTGLLDADIVLSRNKKQSVTAELEGTNSEGDLGFGIGLGYQHRNLAKGSELLSAKLRANYESLSGKFEGLVNKRYTEYAAEVGITFPTFKCPFLSRSFKQRILASTEFAVSFNYQERPEYTRIMTGASWRWKWQQQRRNAQRRHTYDLIDINYVRLPHSTIDFIDQIAPSNPLLRYSYEDHFIMRMGYVYNITNRRLPSATEARSYLQPSVYSFRAAVETAGNLLYAISSMAHQKRSDGVYKILGIQYAQYVKGEADYTYTRALSGRSSLSFHVGAGICYPYGNSSMVPFEKRFYAGGANGVRGWGVRSLGPGRYDARNSVSDFINQCGDIRLDLSVEFRAKLFWVFEGALFVDAGNIWTIKDYENQPGGLFRFDSFYKEIALAYGVGLRMDFTYFLLRFDLGMKAHNPAMNQKPWPVVHPKWSRDANFHFAVGYPF